MTGVIIDVNTQNAEKAQRDLSKLNKSLADMVTKGGSAQAKLNGIDAKNFQNLTGQIKDSNKALKQFETQAVASLNGVDRGVNKINQSIATTRKFITGAAIALTAFGTGFALTRVGDEFTNLNNKLKLVTNSTEQLIRKRQELFNISQKTNADLATTISLYSSFNKSLLPLGISEQRITKFVKGLQQSAAVAGGSMESINGALIQLQQSMSLGLVRGEELNSMFEGLPDVMQRVAKAMNITTGQLRQMGLEGKLTADKFFTAFEKALPGLEKDMSSMTISASKGLFRFTSALKFAAGDVDNYVGGTKGIGTLFAKMADNINGSSQSIIISLGTAKQSFTNYLNDIKAFVNRLAGIDIYVPTPILFDSNLIKKQAKTAIAIIDGTYQAISSRLNIVQRTLGRIKLPVKEFFGDDIAEAVKNVTTSALLVINSFKIMAGNIKALLPNIRLPIIDIFTDLNLQIRSFGKELSTSIYIALLPVRRGIEAFNDYTSFFFAGDNRLPRAVANLFKARSLEDFNGALARVNDSMGFFNGLVRFDSTSYFIREKIRFFKEIGWAIQDAGIYVGLFENKLIRIRDIKLDRIYQTIRLIGDIFQRVYNDRIAPILNLFVYKFTLTALTIGKVLSDALKNTIDLDTGRNIGYTLANGLVEGFRYAVKTIKGFGKNLRFQGSDFGGVFNEIIENLKDATKGIPEFFIGIFNGAIDGAKSALKRFTVDDILDTVARSIGKAINYIITMFGQIFVYADSNLGKVEGRVKQFAERIKEFFYDIWDEVVGHSFWPDTIDGVVDYTKNLFTAETDIKAFKERVIAFFKGIYVGVSKYIAQFATNVQTIAIQLKEVDWGNAAKLIAESFGLVLYAAFNLLKATKFGFVQAFFASYLIGITDFATGGAVQKIANGLSEQIGKQAYDIAKIAFAGAVKGVLVAAGSLTSFFNAFVTDVVGEFFGPFEEAVKFAIDGLLGGIFTLIPLFSNQLIVAYGGITALLAVLNKDLRKSIMGFMFGKSGVFGSLYQVFKGPLLDPSILSSQIVSNLFSSKIFTGLMVTSIVAGLTGIADAGDAIVAALGFGLLSVLGGPGAARVVKEFGLGLSGFIAKAVESGTMSLVNRFLPDTFLKPFFDNMFGNIKVDKKQVRGPLADAFELLREEFVIMSRNIKVGRDAFGAGKISLGDLFFGTGKAGSIKTDFKTIGKLFETELRKSTILNSALNYFSNAGSNAAKSMNEKLKVKPGQKKFYESFGAMIPFFNGIMNGVAKIFSNRLDFMRKILLSKFGKIALFSVLAFGFANIGHAATGATDAISGLNSALAVTATTLIGLAAAWKIGGIFTAFNKGFKDRRTELVEGNLALFTERSRLNIKDTAANIADPVERKRYTTVEGRKLTYEIQEERKRLERAAVGDSVRAGFKSSTERIKAIWASFMSSRFLSITFWANTLNPIKKTGESAAKRIAATNVAQIAGNLGGFAANVGRGSVNLAKATPGAIKDLPSQTKWLDSVYMVSRIDKAITKGGEITRTRAAMGGLAKIAGTLGTIFGTLFNVLRPLGVVISGLLGAIGLGISPAIITVTALVGGFATALVGIFGPMDGFMDNLKYAADKIKGWFGFDATSAGGMQEQFQKKYGKYDFGTFKENATSQLANIGYENLTDKQGKAITTYLKENDQELRSLEAKATLSGTLPASDQVRVQELLDERTRTLAPYMTKDNTTSFGTRINENIKDIVLKDESWYYNLLSNTLGASAANFIAGPAPEKLPIRDGLLKQKVGEGITSAGSFIGNRFNQILSETNKFASDPTSPDYYVAKAFNYGKSLFNSPQQGFLDEYRIRQEMATFDVSPFYDNLDEEGKKRLDTITDRFRDQLKKVADLRNQQAAPQVLDKEQEKLDKILATMKQISGEEAKRAKQLIAREQFVVRQKEFDTIASNLGLTSNSSNFAGGEEGFKLLQKYNKEYADIVKKLATATNFDQQRLLLAKKLSAENRGKAAEERGTNNLLFGTRIEQQRSAIDGKVSAGSLAGYQIIDPKLASRFNDATNEYLRLKTELETAPFGTTAAQLKRMTIELGKAEQTMSALAPLALDLNSINAAMNNFGISNITLAGYINASDDAIVNLAYSIRDTEKAQLEMKNILEAGIDHTNIDEYRAAVQRLRDGINSTKIETAKLIQGDIDKINNIPGLSDQVKAQLIGEATGNNVSTRIKGSAGKSREYNKLSTELQSNSLRQLELKELIDAGKSNNTVVTEYNGLLTKQIALEDKLGKLDDAPSKKKARLTFKEMITALNDTGLQVSDLGFTRLPATAQKSLQSVAAQIDNLNNQLDDIQPGTNVAGLIEQRIDLLNQARKQLIETFDNTGEAIAASLDRSGLSDSVEISKLNAAQIKQITELDKKIENKKLEATNAANAEEYLKITRDIVKLEKEREATVTKLTNSIGKYAERINEAFGTSFELFDISKLGISLAQNLSELATFYKQQLKKLIETGTTDIASGFSESVKMLEDILRKVNVQNTFKDMKDALQNVMLSGAKTAFEKFNEVFPNSGFTEKSFRRLPREQQDEFSQQANDIQWFDAALELYKNKDQRNILEKINDGVSIRDIRDEFEMSYEADYQKILDTMKTPQEKFSGAVDKFDAAVTRMSTSTVNSNQLVGQPASLADAAKMIEGMGLRVSEFKGHSPVGQHTRGSKHYSGNAFDVNFGVGNREWNNPRMKAIFDDLKKKLEVLGFKVLWGTKDHFDHMHVEFNGAMQKVKKAADKVVEDVLPESKEIVVTPDKRSEYNSDATYSEIERRKNALKNMGMNSSDMYDRLRFAGVDERAVNLADRNQLETLDSLAKERSFTASDLQDAKDNGGPVEYYQKQLEYLDEQIRRFADKINENADRVKETIHNFGSAIDNSFRDALTNALTGKGDFFKTLFDGLTTKIIQNAVDSFADFITGENGLLGGLFNNLLKPKGEEGFNPLTALTQFDPISDSPANGGIAGNLMKTAGTATKIFSKGSDVLDSGITVGAENLTKMFQESAAPVAETIGTGMQDAVSNIGSSTGGGMGFGGQMALASMAGGLLGLLIGSLFADGGEVRGPGTGRSDSIVARLSNGEHVINARSAQKYRPLLTAINDDSLGQMMAFADGGIVGKESVGNVIAIPKAMTIPEEATTKSKESKKVEVNLGITGDISRQTRKAVFEMLPQIAEGVNGYNREKGYS